MTKNTNDGFAEAAAEYRENLAATMENRVNRAIKAIRFVGHMHGIANLSGLEIERVADSLACEVGALRDRMRHALKPDFKLNGAAADPVWSPPSIEE